MYFQEFEELAKKQEGRRRKDVTFTTASKIINAYTSRYARTAKRSSEIIRKLCLEFPDINVPKILRPVIDFNRV